MKINLTCLSFNRKIVGASQSAHQKTTLYFMNAQ